MNGQYILNGKTPVECNDLMEWAKQMEGKNRIVEQSQLGGVKVSTVFLGLDHSFGDGQPLLFETMIFRGEHDQYQDRYSTWDEAVEGHKKACKIASLV